MTVKEFDEFVERQQGAGPIDWDRERDEWLAHLDALYRKIETMLGSYISSGQIKTAYKSIDLNEDDIGSYQARQMILWIGRQEVDIVPAGTRFVGFKGFVEVIGSAGKASLALANKDRQSTVPEGPHTRRLKEIVRRHRADSELTAPLEKPEWVWKILPRPPGRNLDELTPESFFQLLMEVTNG
jgi:hypothetical protein